MLCLPGLTPVAKLDHAVGDSEGCVEPRRAKTPSSASALRFGSFPSSIHFRASVGSIPSKPMTKTRSFERRRGLPPSGPFRQSTRGRERARAATRALALARGRRAADESIEGTCLGQEDVDGLTQPVYPTARDRRKRREAYRRPGRGAVAAVAGRGTAR